MSNITLYGTSASRALRSLWAIEEVGVEYEHVPTHFTEDSKTPEYLAINPNGRIPALIDGDLVLFESMAINQYLARTYGGDLYPDGAPDQARAMQWSVWGISEIEPLQMQIVIESLFKTPETRDTDVIARAKEGLNRPLAVLNDHLAGRDYLLGENFSFADLNVAGVMLLLQMVKHDYSSHANVQRWAEACYARPSLAAAQARE
ncbi:MAG: glutathione S-transferase family protein [Pseudomonadales bacterium]|jgi:glutathione S-transferase|nr:glutathione S-transferase family protein [Pseudomonadales bacterium]MDP6471623.1 glutathione S-transferase family protein [Pseudomonadales bacterium]MDP6970500.1 glutathione S-transferase family protein [Pseudomonadales bacterium]|tara:strand:- start:172 stop:783 length:612 start_codon:yes stop_codon:yes gene_type:complete